VIREGAPAGSPSRQIAGLSQLVPCRTSLRKHPIQLNWRQGYGFATALNLMVRDGHARVLANRVATLNGREAWS
jgi:hypothetical protein